MKEKVLKLLRDRSRPLIAASVSDMDLGMLDTGVLAAADLLELRVDLFGSFSDKHLSETFRKAGKYGKPLIGTIRSEKEGGKHHFSEQERLSLFGIIIEYADIIDVEAKSEILSDVIDMARERGSVLIASFHDFEKTPSYNELSEMVFSVKKKGADIVKIATMPRNSEDIEVMTRLTLQHSKDNIVTICMGESGLITRVFFPVIGSLFTFASVGEAKAPGQVSVVKLRELMEQLCKGI